MRISCATNTYITYVSKFERMSEVMETKMINYYGEMFKLNKITDELWISDATDHEECLVFELCDGTWYRSFYTTDEVESEFNQI